MTLLLDLTTPVNWPADLLAYLTSHHDLFLGWESGCDRCTAAQYDEAMTGLANILQRYAVIGWHCSRLTEAEIDGILAEGMQLPSPIVLHRRLDTVVSAGCLSAAMADRLKAVHQAADTNRAGMIWFSLYPPRSEHEENHGWFFRYWGGEALYNSHAENPETGPALTRIGQPCIIEAHVPIASLKQLTSLCSKVARRYLIHRGYQTVERCDHDDAMVRPLQSANVRKVVRFLSPEFVALTACDKWDNPLLG